MHRSDPARLFCIVLLTALGTLVAIDRLAPLILPAQTFLFRGWEYAAGAARYNVPRTNFSYPVREYGDLGNMLGVSRFKQWRWDTYTMDAKGYRNTLATTHADPQIVVVGDSFIAGVGNTDANTFTSRLQAGMKSPVTARTPGDLSQLLMRGKLPAKTDHQRILVWGRVERNLVREDPEIQAWLHDTTCFAEVPAALKRMDAWKDPVKRMVGPIQEYADLSLLRRMSQTLYEESRFAITGGHMGAVTIADGASGLLFYGKDMHLLGRSGEDRGLGDVAKAIAHARDCLQKRGYTLVFVPIPDKSHVYFSSVPSDMRPASPLSPDPMDMLSSLLTRQRVLHVPVWSAFQSYARFHKDLGTDLLYWKDDTHWNPQGIRIAVDETIRLLRRFPSVSLR